jgi:hypothetical protein
MLCDAQEATRVANIRDPRCFLFYLDGQSGYAFFFVTTQANRAKEPDKTAWREP